MSRSRAIRPGERSTAGDAGAGERQLGGLAARRRAEIGDGFAGDVAEQPHRQGGGGVLHPPLALGKARQHRHEPCNSVRTVPVGSVSPCSRVAHCAASGFHVISSERFMAERYRDLGAWFRGRNARSSVPAAGRTSSVCDLTSSISGWPSRAQRRSTALTSPGIFRGAPVDCTSRTDRSTGGVIGHSIQRICAAPIRSALCGGARRSPGCRDRAAATTHDRACRPPQDGRHRRRIRAGRDRQASSGPMGAERRRVGHPLRRLCSTPSRISAAIRAPQDLALRMQGEALMEAWTGTSRAMRQREALRSCHRRKNICGHGNMPNVRIALPFHDCRLIVRQEARSERRVLRPEIQR